MFWLNKSLLNLKAGKLGFSNSILVKLEPTYIFKKTIVSRIQLQNFCLSSCVFSNKKKDSISNISFPGIEQIARLKRISKKKNKLSAVDEKDLELLDKLKKGESHYSIQTDFSLYKDAVVEDVKAAGREAFYYLSNVQIEGVKKEYFDNYSDILIIGGGAVGLSIAYSIRNQFPQGPKITVVDKDCFYPHLSTNLGQSMISLQLFNEEEEISILKYGAQFFSAFTRNTEINENAKFALNYDPLGSLLLVDESNMNKVLQNHEKLSKFGVKTKVINKATLEKKFPWLNFKNILFGSLGMYGEGIINPWVYIYALKCKCVSLGVTFVTAEVIDFGFERGTIRRAICKLPNGSYNFINFAYVVLASGLESLNLVNLLNQAVDLNYGLRLPLEERMRYEFCCYNSKGPGLNTPIIINPDGTYFRREDLTGHYVVGVPSVVYNDQSTDSNDDEKSKPYYVFENIVKPFLIERMPHLREVNFFTGWIDVYDFCVANNVGITGPHPSTKRIIFALGFSHLGLHYLPALGRGVMEFIIHDTYQTINFEPFHIENLWRKQHIEADKKRRELLEAQQKVTLSEQ